MADKPAQRKISTVKDFVLFKLKPDLFVAIIDSNDKHLHIEDKTFNPSLAK
ncbi:hypothetical protein DSCW_60710 [Desulfosarcina widdelii]|uniref:Uncharacterized protein n=1 Tax=Desulfosarcina widdelii TaxID=947919 RepID=A0A5K7ZK70_9BACT|nr:hypothetical protein [Desulfosarcina widdelii]BBO78654.1 hypothetical protein DSCW_60710 [Desulfosarcina widdelii]